MNVNRTALLLSCLSSHFTTVGYFLRKSASEFRKSLDSGDMTAVWVDLLAASQRGYFKASLSARIRIAAIEAVYVDHHPLIPPKERKNHFTLSLNCDNLFRDKAISQSFNLPDERAVEALADLLWPAITEDVLPFLDRYGNQRALVENLASDDYRSWVTSDRMVRCTVLMSDRALAADRSGFEHWATELMTYCRQPHGQMYLPVATAIVPAVRAQFFKP